MVQFTPFNGSHLSFLRSWLQKDHIKTVWQETENDNELKEKFLNELPSVGVRPFIFSLDKEIIGYIQYYNAYGFKDGWWEDEKPGTYGIDLMIGDERKIGKGIGPMILREFISLMKKEVSGLKSIIIDPDPLNLKAIRAFEKVGFIKEAEIQTPNGSAVLMRLTIQ